jgi:hypothetical protein
LFDLLQRTEPKRAQAFLQALRRIELLHQENILMMMPYDFMLE